MKRCNTVYSKGKKRKAWKKGARKNFSNEKENENISFNFYL